jgi:hypothetical protein
MFAMRPVKEVIIAKANAKAARPVSAFAAFCIRLSSWGLAEYDAPGTGVQLEITPGVGEGPIPTAGRARAQS